MSSCKEFTASRSPLPLELAIASLGKDTPGPFCGKMFFIIVDSHSKWAEVIEMTNTTAAATIKELRQLFATHGLPEQVVSDNGPQFASKEFSIFLKNNGVKHMHTVCSLSPILQWNSGTIHTNI